MKTTGTFGPTLIFRISAGGWTWGGQGSFSGVITRKGAKVTFSNIKAHVAGVNNSGVSGTIRADIRASSTGSTFSSGTVSVANGASYSGDITLGDFTRNVGSAGSVSYYGRITWQASETGQIGYCDIPITLPDYTPPTYGSVNGQSKFIDTLYGAIPDVTSMTISPTFPAYNALVTNIDPVTMGGALVDPSIYSIEGMILDTLSLDYDHSSGDLTFAFNLHEVGGTTPIQEIQDIDTPANLEMTLAGYGIAIDPSFSSGSDMSYIININPTYSRYKSKKLKKLYGSVNGVAKRIY